jgi:hypothetical protein
MMAPKDLFKVTLCAGLFYAGLASLIVSSNTELNARLLRVDELMERRTAGWLSLLPPPTAVPGDSISFPGCEGFGCRALTARSATRCDTLPMQILKVTTLAHTGKADSTDATHAGGWPWVLNQIRNDRMTYIVFTTGGTQLITSQPMVMQDKKCVYVAGQTAPGGGIRFLADSTGDEDSGIKGWEIGNGQDIVLRHVRISQRRCTKDTTGPDPECQANRYNLGIFTTGDDTTRNIVLDHLSLGPSYNHMVSSHATDVGANDTTRAGQITYQWLLFGPVYSLGSGICWRFQATNVDAAAGKASRNWWSSAHYNASINCGWRQPNAGLGPVVVQNDLVHNHNSGTARIRGDSMAPTGQDSARLEILRRYHTGIALSNLDNFFNCWSEDVGANSWWGYYHAVLYRNYMQSQFDSLDNIFPWTEKKGVATQCAQSTGIIDTTWSASIYASIDSPKYKPPMWLAANVDDSLGVATTQTVSDSRLGDYQGVDSTGTWFYRRDALDSLNIQRIIDRYTGSNPSHEIIWFGGTGFPTLAAGSPYSDTDGDAMPDAFEDLYAVLDKNNGADKDNDPDGDGFENLAEWVNGTDPTVYNNADGSEEAADQTSSDIPSFPGCYGFGCDALTGRSANRCDTLPIQIVRVTNTDSANTSSGSLKWALEQTHNDSMTYVIFETGGKFQGAGSSSVSRVAETKNKKCLYVAGQTAPGGGFQISNAENVNGSVAVIDGSEDIVYRYLYIRQPECGNDTTPSGDCSEQDNLQILAKQKRSRHLVLDHLSLNYTNDEILAFSPATGGVSIDTMGDFTFQWILIGPTLSGHPTCWNGSGSNEDSVDAWDWVSWHYSGSSTCGYRQPRTKQPVVVQNDVIYDWASRTAQLSGDSLAGVTQQGVLDDSARLEILRRYMKPGSGDNDNMFTCWSEDSGTKPNAWWGYYHAVLLRNYIEGIKDTTDSELDYSWKKGGSTTKCAENTGIIDTVFSASIYASADSPKFVPPMWSAVATYDSLIGSSVSDSRLGNYRGLNCDGTWNYRRDGLDSALIQNIISDADPVIPDDHKTFYPPDGWDVPAAGTACTDTDGDGMPNEFEDAYSSYLNKNDATDDDEDPDSDGWYNLQEYLNGSNPTVFTNPDGSEAGAGGAGDTFGDGRNVYLEAPIQIVDTTRAGGVIDTSYVPDTSDITLNSILYTFLYNADTTLMLVLTYANVSGLTPMDSAAAIDSTGNWGYSPADTVRTMSVPGEP